MADEITASISLLVNKTNTAGDVTLVRHISQGGQFQADMTGSSGPYVGTVLIQRTYTVIDLSRVGTPGMARFKNQDASNLVEIGVWYPAGNDFIPFIELLPGESCLFRLSRYIGQNLVPGTGTGTGDLNVNYFAMKASGGTVNVLCEIFPQ